MMHLRVCQRKFNISIDKPVFLVYNINIVSSADAVL